MQIKKILEIESIIADRKIPCDMDTLNFHKSQSTGKEIKLVDMHLPHLLRAYSRLIDTDKLVEKGINAAKESVDGQANAIAAKATAYAKFNKQFASDMRADIKA